MASAQKLYVQTYILRPPNDNVVWAASSLLMPAQAVDDDPVHFRKLLGSELVDPILDLAPDGAVVPAGSVVGCCKDAVRFLVQDHPAVGERVTRGFEDGVVLPDGIEESGPYLGVFGAGGRES